MLLGFVTRVPISNAIVDGATREPSKRGVPSNLFYEKSLSESAQKKCSVVCYEEAEFFMMHVTH